MYQKKLFFIKSLTMLGIIVLAFAIKGVVRWLTAPTPTPVIEGVLQRPAEEVSKAAVERPVEELPLEEVAGKFILVDDFNKGATSGVYYQRLNSLGAYQGTWAKRPSYTVLTKSSKHRRGDRGKGLCLEFRKETAGWCGWYTLLNGIDISDYNALTFWVKGEKGGEKFDIGLADSRMQELQIDAVYAGPIDLFLPLGVTTEWQQAKVPLSRVEAELDTSSMGSMVLWFRYGGAGKIYLEDVRFALDPEVEKIEEYNAPRAEFDPEHPRSLWVWKIDPVNNPKARRDLFELCQRAAITIIYLYFGEFDLEAEKEYVEGLAAFLEQAHQRGLKVEALTGTPIWALSENHKACLDWIETFLRFNKERLRKSRMDGVSLDVEPYLTTEWNTVREQIKAGYIELLKKVKRLVESYGQDFRVGVAIPQFYSEIEEGKFEKEILGLVDYVALMAYNDDGRKIIEKAAPHLEMARQMDKKITIGVETQDLIRLHQGERRFTFFEEGWEHMEKELGKVKEAFAKNPALEGFAIHCYYSYRLLQRGRSAPQRERPKKIYQVYSVERTSPLNVDGSLDDWDTSRPYHIDKKENAVHGKFAWGGPMDLSCVFYSMWDKNNLYFSFEVTDDKIVQEKTEDQMWEGDHVEFWLDIDLEGDYNESINSPDDFQFGLSPGNFTNLEHEVFVWIPYLDLDYTELVELAVQRTDKGYNIEARIPAGLLFSSLEKRVGVEPVEGVRVGHQPLFEDRPPLEFNKGMRLGVSIDPSDCDDAAVPQKVLLSSSPTRAWGDPTTFGILNLE